MCRYCCVKMCELKTENYFVRYIFLISLSVLLPFELVVKQSNTCILLTLKTTINQLLLKINTVHSLSMLTGDCVTQPDQHSVPTLLPSVTLQPGTQPLTLFPFVTSVTVVMDSVSA